jgi:hypothetical protein
MWVDEVDEGSLAVDFDDREPLSVLGLQLVVPADVDFLQLEGQLRAGLFEDRAGPLAEVTARRVVERDLRDKCREW